VDVSLALTVVVNLIILVFAVGIILVLVGIRR
jgi:hypothetical protein